MVILISKLKLSVVIYFDQSRQTYQIARSSINKDTLCNAKLL